jgi:hypothetical protein
MRGHSMAWHTAFSFLGSREGMGVLWVQVCTEYTLILTSHAIVVQMASDMRANQPSSASIVLIHLDLQPHIKFDTSILLLNPLQHIMRRHPRRNRNNPKRSQFLHRHTPRHQRQTSECSRAVQEIDVVD